MNDLGPPLEAVALSGFGLRQRMIVFLGLFLLVLMGVIAVWEAQRERDLVTTQMQADGLSLAKAYALSAENALLLKGAGLARVTGEASRSAGIRYLAIMNEYCRVIAHTDPAQIGTFRRDAEISQVLGTPLGAVEAGRTPVISRQLDDSEDEVYRVLVPLVLLEQVKGVMEIGLETDLIRNLRLSITREVALIALAALLIGVTVAVLFARSLTRPVLDLAQSANRIAGGELDVPILTRAQGEIGLLAGSLETMRLELAGSFSQLRAHAAEIERLKIFSENILNSISPGVITLDLEGRLSGANLAALSLLGLDLAAVLGKAHGQVFAAWPELASATSALVNGVPVDCELVLAGGAGPRLVRVSGSELRDQQGSVIGDVLELDDLTLLRSMERRVNDAEKMAVMGELAAGVAHEVRNPLGAIRNAAQFLEGKLPAGEPSSRFPRLIMGEVDRLNSLVSRLLQFTRRELGGFELQDIRESIENAVALAELKLAGGRIRIECAYAADLPPVLADARRLVQVFVNLLFNAIEAISGQGCIRVGAIPQGAPGRPGILVTVTDSGPGVPPDRLERIFEPFFTTREAGTGLGLSIVRQIVEEHGGTVSAGNVAGGGLEVRLVFPEGSAGMSMRSDGWLTAINKEPGPLQPPGSEGGRA